MEGSQVIPSNGRRVISPACCFPEVPTSVNSNEGKRNNVNVNRYKSNIHAMVITTLLMLAHRAVFLAVRSCSPLPRRR